MILAIDPGLTTGWATFDGLSEETNDFRSGMVKGRYEFYEWFYKQLSRFYSGMNHLTVVMERFTITAATAKKSPQMDPLYIIGHVEAICHRDDIPFEFQLPSQAMSFATNDKLRAVNWYKPGPGHDNDAARHLLLWLVKHPDRLETTKGKDLLWEIAEKLGIAAPYERRPLSPIEVVHQHRPPTPEQMAAMANYYEHYMGY